MTLGSQQGRVVMLLSNPATFDERPLREAHALAKSGFDVSILAWDRESATQSDSRYPDGLEIRRMRLPAGHGTPLITVPKLMIFYMWCFVHLTITGFDVLHCHDVDTLPVG